MEILINCFCRKTNEHKKIKLLKAYITWQWNHLHESCLGKCWKPIEIFYFNQIETGIEMFSNKNCLVLSIYRYEAKKSIKRVCVFAIASPHRYSNQIDPIVLVFRTWKLLKLSLSSMPRIFRSFNVLGHRQISILSWNNKKIPANNLVIIRSYESLSSC